MAITNDPPTRSMMKGVRRGWSECTERSQMIPVRSIDRSDVHSDGEHQAIPACRKRSRTLTSDGGKRFCQVSQEKSCSSTEWIDEERRGLEKAASAEILETLGDQMSPSTSIRSRTPGPNDEPSVAMKRQNFSESRRKRVLQRIQRPNSALSILPSRCKTPTPLKQIENQTSLNSCITSPTGWTKENLGMTIPTGISDELNSKTNQITPETSPPSMARRYSRSNLKKRSDSMGKEEAEEWPPRIKQNKRERRNSSAPPVQNRLMRRRNAMFMPMKKMETPATSSGELHETLFCDSSDEDQTINSSPMCSSFDEFRLPSMKYEWGIDAEEGEEKDDESEADQREIDEEQMEILCREGTPKRSCNCKLSLAATNSFALLILNESFH